LVTLLFAFLIATILGALFNPVTGVAPLDKSRNAPGKALLSGVECLVRPFQICENIQDGVARENDSEISVAPVQESKSADAINKQQYTIYVQFAGYQRSSVIKAVQSLRTAGWKVAGGDQGGERLAAAAGRSQVLYGNGNAMAAADQLANDINQTGIKSDVKAVLNPSVVDGTLEIWIGQ
jgi:ABC-type transport system substrate-binding protein